MVIYRCQRARAVFAFQDYMELKKRLKSLTLIALALSLAGFTGNERFVELEGYLNGRSSAAFRAKDKNIKTVLNKGTRGEIVEKKKLLSGNYGLRVKVLSGKDTGKTVWVYYNVNNPDLALYDTAPQTWDEVSRASASVETAAGTEALRDTQAVDDTDKTSQKAFNESLPKGDHDARNAIDAIAAGQQGLDRIAVPTPRPDCSECSKPVTEVPLPASEDDLAAAVIGVSTRPMSPRCAVFINRDGGFGSMGASAMKIMNEPQYVNHFTKSNALGKFCPNFNTFTNSEKLQAWTWFWGALAHEETQCVQEITHATHVRRNGRTIRINPRPGYGYFALEKDANVRASRGRACRSIIGDGVGQMRCAIDIMKQTTLADGQTASSDSLSYWGPVRRGNSQIMPHMKRFKACF